MKMMLLFMRAPEDIPHQDESHCHGERRTNDHNNQGQRRFKQ
jgi:hypothetical protein